MKIILAAHMGMCFGVRDAIALAETEQRSAPITILGDLVHNETVLDDLRARGIQFEHDAAAVSTPAVMITAHGTSEKALSALAGRGLRVVEATCPLVHHAHRALQKLVRDGYHPVVIGRRDHVEVRGMTDDLERFDILLHEEDLNKIEPRPRFGVVAQTTQAIDKVRRLVTALQVRFPEADVVFVDTVCQPTKQRQTAAVQLAERADVVVVIGGAHSNNTRELVVTCRERCPRVYHVCEAADLRSIWFRPEDTVGITAGTSTPDKTIKAVIGWLEDFAAFQADLSAHVESAL